MTRLTTRLALAATLALLAPAGMGHSQEQEWIDPRDRYQREPLPTSRREDMEVQRIPEPAVDTPPSAQPRGVLPVPQPGRWDGYDRRDHRASEMPVADEYLDPTWPTDATDTRIAPEESDSVENVPLDDQALDEAEHAEAERYKDALGLNNAPDDFSEDHWGSNAAERTREREIKEYEDPAEW